MVDWSSNTFSSNIHFPANITFHINDKTTYTLSVEGCEEKIVCTGTEIYNMVKYLKDKLNAIDDCKY